MAERAEPTLTCQGCGWSVTLPFTDENTVSIEAVEGWAINPTEHEVLCERCSTGWRPEVRSEFLACWLCTAEFDTHVERADHLRLDHPDEPTWTAPPFYDPKVTSHEQ